MSTVRILSGLALAFMAAAPLAAQTAKFEEPKPDVMQQQDGIQLHLGGAFTQTFQDLTDNNAAAAQASADNQLADIGAGFNLASANLHLDADLAPGTKVVLDGYLSSRHHNEAWVKGGYLLMDASPIDWEPLNMLMQFVTLKVGHFELNYGDAHFRRSDNGYTIANPFVENLILDAFTTEIGGEGYLRMGPLLAMAGVTNGLNKGSVTNPGDRGLAFLGKVGWDQTFSNGVRARLTASTYRNGKAGRATLYHGDRAGSAYWGVMDNAAQADAWNGRLDPNFTRSIHAVQVNPYVQYGNLELFGVIEKSKGHTAQETADRQVTQYDADAVYHLLDNKLFVGARYNTVSGEFTAPGADEGADRSVLSAGWFVTPNVLLKGEYVTQKYTGFDASSILDGGKFHGIVVQGSVAF